MSDFNTVIDLGTDNIRINVFNNSAQSIFLSQIKNNNNSETSLSRLIRSAEKKLSMHIDYVNVLYDSSKFKSIDLSIKKSFDKPTLISKQYKNTLRKLILLLKKNYFKDHVIHLIVNNIIIDEFKEIEIITDEIKIKSLILEIKFICLSKLIVKNISELFKKNNLNISNIFCTSYVKSIFYKKSLSTENNYIFLDIGFERTSAWFFKYKKLYFFYSVSIGGNHITKDISKILKLNKEYSEDLKTKFNLDENESFYNRNINNEINEKNIPVDLLKQIIKARIDEIIQLALNSNKTKEINFLENSIIVFIGSGSKLLPSILDHNSRNNFKKLIFFEETDSMICQAGFEYYKTEESRLIIVKDKSKKTGFFETFFNFFSK